MRRTRFVVCAALLAAAGRAQQPDEMESIRAAVERSAAIQREGIERQRTSVREQAGVPSVPAGEFFTLPWTAPVAAAPAPVPVCDPVPEERIGPVLEAVSKREGLTPDLLRAVVARESAFLPCSVSPKGAQGLMQLMPATVRSLGITDPFDPEENVAGGARLLRQLLTRYDGDLTLALGAYNAGPSAVDWFGTLPPYRETIRYVSDILQSAGRSSEQKRAP